MSHVILTGATGLAGSQILQNLLSHPQISKISILSRRPVKAAENQPKANVIIQKDFTTYSPELLKEVAGAEACIWAQGISSIGMSEKDYEVITYQYPISAAKSFSSLSQNFKFIYISGEGADQSEKASQMFGRIKGRTEKHLVDLTKSPEYSSTGLTVYNLRPGGIDHEGDYHGEKQRQLVERIMEKTLVPLMRIGFKSMLIPAKSLADVSIQLAIGDGKAVTGSGVEVDGFTLRNIAIRRLAGLA